MTDQRPKEGTEKLTAELLRLAAALDDDDDPVAFDGNLVRDAALEIVTLRRVLSEEQRLLELAKLALRKIGEFDKYEPAGPAAAAARSTLSVLEAK